MHNVIQALSLFIVKSPELGAKISTNIVNTQYSLYHLLTECTENIVLQLGKCYCLTSSLRTPSILGNKQAYRVRPIVSAVASKIHMNLLIGQPSGD
jgi:hypothetical protein